MLESPNRTALACRAVLLSLLVYLAGCGPAAIAIGVSSGGGGGDAPPPLALTVTQAAGGLTGRCARTANFDVDVNKPNLVLQARIAVGLAGDEVVAQDFTNVAFTDGQPVAIGLFTGRNVVTFRGAVGDEEVETQAIEIVVPAAADLRFSSEVIDVGLRVSWPTADDHDGNYQLLRLELAGVPDDMSPSSVAALLADAATEITVLTGADIGRDATPGGPVREFNIELTRPAAGEAARFFALGLRADDGCESDVVFTSLQPLEPTLAWAEANGPTIADMRTLTTHPTTGVRPQSVPGIFLDRNGDTNGPQRGPDGLDDLLVVDDQGDLLTHAANGSGFEAADLDPSGPQNSTFKIMPQRIDGDALPDFVAVGNTRISGMFGNPSGPANFSQIGTISLSGAEQFVNAELGDFDGDTLVDIAYSVADFSGPNPTNVRYEIGYAQRNPNGGHEDEWPTQIGIMTGAQPGDSDGFTFIVADLNHDGRTDLVQHRELASGQFAFVTHLLRGRGMVDTVVSDPFADQGIQDLRWDRSFFIDVNHDGDLDLVTSRQVGSATFLASYLNLGEGRISSSRFFNFGIDATPFDRAQFLPADVEGDGLIEILVHRTSNGSATIEDVRVFRSQRQLDTGLQNWQQLGLSDTLPIVTPAGTMPAVPFSVTDFDFDGVLDFVSLRDVGGTWETRLLQSDPASVDLQSPTATEFSPSAFSVAGTTAPTALQAVAMSAPDDLFLGTSFDGTTNTVRYLAARRSGGLLTGGTTEPRSFDVTGLTEELVSVVPHRRMPTNITEFVGLTASGIVGELRFVPGNTFQWVPSMFSGTASELELVPADFNGDDFGDCVVVQRPASGDPSLLIFLGSPIVSGNRAALMPSMQGSITIAGTVGFVGAIDVRQFNLGIPSDGRDDVIAVVTPTGSSDREVQMYVANFFESENEPRLALRAAASPATIPADVTSMIPARFDVTAGVNEGLGTGLVAGGADGNVYEIFIGTDGPTPAQISPRVQPSGTGNIVLVQADVNQDGLPDVVMFDETATTLQVLTLGVEDDPAFPWRVRGNAEFLPSLPITLDNHLPVLGIADRNSDGRPDLLAVRRAPGDGGDFVVETWTNLGSGN